MTERTLSREEISVIMKFEKEWGEDTLLLNMVSLFNKNDKAIINHEIKILDHVNVTMNTATRELRIERKDKLKTTIPYQTIKRLSEK